MNSIHAICRVRCICALVSSPVRGRAKTLLGGCFVATRVLDVRRIWLWVHNAAAAAAAAAADDDNDNNNNNINLRINSVHSRHTEQALRGIGLDLVKADPHIACRSPAMPCRWWFRMCLSHLIYTVRPCPIHTFHDMLRPCRSSQGHSTARPSLDMSMAWQVWIRHGRAV